MLELIIQRAFEAPGTPGDADFSSWFEAALKDRREGALVSLRLVDIPESQQLNLQYRQKDQATNVLSFPTENDLPAGLPVQLQAEMDNNLGDLVICGPLVIKEAEQQGKLLAHHWAHLLTHGCLHLLGFDHLEDEQAKVMESLEIEILAKQGIPNPYSN